VVDKPQASVALAVTVDTPLGNVAVTKFPCGVNCTLPLVYVTVGTPELS